jgi:protein TonB
MRAEAIRTPQRWRRPRSSRAVAFLLVLFIHALIAVVLLTITPRAKLAKMGRNAMETFNILDPKPESQDSPPPAAQPKAEPKKATPSQPKSAPTLDAPAPPVDLGVLAVDLDIRKLPNRREEVAAAADAPSTLPDSKVVSTGRTYGPSLNPPSMLSGKTLYAAEWHREPTDAELAFYLPKTGIPRGSWALVACRTVANFHVEDCQEMGDSRPGSGLSRAIRNAAWQFRVRPPRVDGQYKVGEWVQIRIDFTEPPPAP